jgi:hypothetical protein
MMDYGQENKWVSVLQWNVNMFFFTRKKKVEVVPVLLIKHYAMETCGE